MWKKVDNSGNPPQILAIDGRIIIKDETRFSIVHFSKIGSKKGSILRIVLAEECDAGQYICQLVGSKDMLELKHTVKGRGESSDNLNIVFGAIGGILVFIGIAILLFVKIQHKANVTDENYNIIENKSF